MRYDIIYMDPPWKYNDRMLSGSKAEDHYPTMTVAELKDMNVYDLMSDNSLLYMWTTNPYMETSIDIANHWGLDFKTVAFVWEKQRPTTGHYTMGSCEFVLVFKKGKIPQPRGTRNARQFLSEKRRQHSRKPDEIRRRIEQMHPTQTKLEMFARTTTEGWDVWGNETDKFEKYKPTL